MHKQKRIGILGIGNLLMRDEGFGVHFIEYLTSHYVIPDHVSVLDGGTAGIMLAPFMEDADILYVIDTVAVKDVPGSIHRFTDDDVRTGNIHTRMSPHQVGLLDILALCKLRDRAPEQTEMITIVPENLDIAIGLSSCLQPKLAEVAALLLESLARHDTILQPRETLTSA
ncbi:MAG: HyaD/HybD family hydrogenase maturation endopeptidase [Desulfobulbaceae bacterium]|nr:HyaD/HybD family hydrogenase maturation endopeptidase [Desulfobulbaceae bacterium]